MGDLVRIANRAARRRAEIEALTLPRFETDPRDADWQVDYDTGLAHLFTDILFRDRRARLWIAPSCGCEKTFCRNRRALLYGTGPQTGTGTPSDGSSLPRFGWFATNAPLAPENAIPGFLHDHAYRTGRLADGTPITRIDADQMYREACPLHPEISREAAAGRYYILRLAGWYRWLIYRHGEKSNGKR